MAKKARLVVLASGFGSNLEAILFACEDNLLPAKVVAVISDRGAAYALERARDHNIAAVYHPWKPYREAGKSRQEYDTDLADLTASFEPDYVILAGWMRILSMDFLRHFPMKVINLHPALPGTFPGTQAIERAFEAFQAGQIEHTGVMVHFVPDEGVDDGPVIAQEVIPIYDDDTLDGLEQRVHAIEHQILVEALQKAILEKFVHG